MRRISLNYALLTLIMISMSTAQAASGWVDMNTWLVWRGGW